MTEDQPDVCNNGACCGPYRRILVTFEWAPSSDDTVGDDVRYNVYRREDDGSLTVVVPFVQGTSMRASIVCSGSGLFLPALTSGTYLVRAVDWAGNEDGNTNTHQVVNACDPATGGTTLRPANPGCAVAGTTSAGDATHGGALGVALVALGWLVASRRRRRHFT